MVRLTLQRTPARGQPFEHLREVLRSASRGGSVLAAGSPKQEEADDFPELLPLLAANRHHANGGEAAVGASPPTSPPTPNELAMGPWKRPTAELLADPDDLVPRGRADSAMPWWCPAAGGGEADVDELLPPAAVEHPPSAPMSPLERLAMGADRPFPAVLCPVLPCPSAEALPPVLPTRSLSSSVHVEEVLQTDAALDSIVLEDPPVPAPHRRLLYSPVAPPIGASIDPDDI